jgi:hypothetical protein
MKKITAALLVGLAIFALTSSANAVKYATDPPNGFVVLCKTLTLETVAVPVTFESGAVCGYDLTARGGDIKFLGTVNDATTTEYQTIFQDHTKYNQMPEFIAKNTIWYFAPKTANTTIEIQYWYY